MLLLSPTATITSTNIHLFCDVFLMQHINWLCCCLHHYSIISHFSRISFFFFFFFFLLFFLFSSFFSFFFFPVMLYYSYTLMFSLFLQHCCYVVVCRFVRSLMAFVCQEIKGLLTYLLAWLCSAWLLCVCECSVFKHAVRRQLRTQLPLSPEWHVQRGERLLQS